MSEMLLTSLLEQEADNSQFMDRLSPEKQARIKKSIARIKTGLHTVAPLTCSGPRKCPFIKHCPIPDIDDSGILIYGADTDYPINRACVLEDAFMKQKTYDYIQHMNVDVENPVEMGLVNELALIDLYKNRAAMILSAGDKRDMGQDFLLIDRSEQDNGNGENNKMTMSTTTQLHPALALIDQLEKRREKLLVQLVQTRKAQTEISIKMGKKRDESQLLAEMKKMRAILDSQQPALQVVKETLIPIKD